MSINIRIPTTDPNTDPSRKYYIILDLEKLTIELRVLTQALGCSLRTIVSHVRLAPGLKRHAIGCTDFFDNSRSQKNHGIQFQSILLISYHLPQAIHQYW